jgi:hypothetical protein
LDLESKALPLSHTSTPSAQKTFVIFREEDIFEKIIFYVKLCDF